MYNTSINYKKNVYTCRQHELKIYIDEQRINDSYIFDFNSNYELLTDKIELGSTPMQQIELTLHKDAIPNTHQEIYIESGILNGEIVPVGYFTIVDIQDENEYTTKIVANDYMDKFEFNFDGSNYVPCSTGALLSHICNQAGVELATTTFLNSNVVINVYDNTISARKFISMIAEQAGGFACIGRDGKLYIKNFENTSYIENYTNQTHIDLETSVNATTNITKIYGNEDGLSGTVDLCIDEVEKSIYLVDLFKQVYVNLLNGNLNISLPSELADIVEYSLDSNGNLIAYVYDIYGNKLDFSINISGILIADIDLESRVVISRNKITINLGSFVLGEDDYIEYNSSTEKWYIFQNNTSTEITNTTVLNSLNQLLDVSLNKGTIEIYLENDVSAISMNCTNFVEIPIELFKEYEFSKELFKCTRLYYEDGIRSFDYGNQTGNTIYVNSDNMFIVDDGNNKSTQLQNVFNKINGLELRGFKGSSIVDIAIDIGDIVYINGEPVLYQGSWEYQGRNKASISSEIQSKSKEETTTVKVSTDVKIRRIQSNIDQMNGTITLLGQQVTENENAIAQLNLNVNGIEQFVRNEIDITRNKTAVEPIIIENAMKGNLLELHIYGNNGVFSEDSLIKVYTNNKCKDSISNWEQCVVNTNNGLKVYNSSNSKAILTTKNYIEISSNQTYISIENDNYKIINCYGYDENENYVGAVSNVFGWDSNKQEGYVNWNNSVKKILISIAKMSYDETNQIYEEINADAILQVKPMLTYSTTKQEYCGYNNFTLDLGVNETLRRLEKQDGTIVRDEFELINNKAKVIRRIGLDEDEQLYELEEEIIQDLGEIIVPVSEGNNTFEIINYSALCYLKWIIKNNYTNTFATTVDLQASIETLANSINLQVTQINNTLDNKVGVKEIIAKLNLAIENEEGIVIIEGNRLIINTDYTKLDANGKFTTTAGIIGKWTLSENGLFWGNATIGNIVYQCGLDTRNNNYAFYAGIDVSDGQSHNLSEANAYITKSGLMKAKWFEVNGESGYFYIKYDSGRTAMNFNKDSIIWKLDNNTNNLFAMLWKASTGMHFSLYDAPYFVIRDDVHNYDEILNIVKYNPSSSIFYENLGHSIIANADVRIEGNRYDGINYTMRIQGYEVATNASDERLKENIEDSKDVALDKTDKIKIRSFDWRKDKHLNQGGKHVNNGYVAQEVIEVDETLVNYSEENDTYQMNLLNLSALHTKAIQELNKIIKKQNAEILALKEEISNIKEKYN